MPPADWKPLTPETLEDFEALFGERGACAGCWCMYYRRSAKDYKANQGAGNKAAMRKLVRSGISPGVLLYEKGKPVGWCAIAPRAQLIRLAGSRILAPVDNAPVWSISCFFVDKPHRRRGVSGRLLNAALEFAAQNGAKIVEGYPHDFQKDANKNLQPDAFLWTGLLPTFLNAGFREVERRSESRPIVRKAL